MKRVVHNLATIFYAEDGITASPHLARLQEALVFLTELFDLVGLI